MSEIKMISNLSYSGIDEACRIHLFLPVEKGAKPLPLIIMIHGGGWQGGNQDQYLGHSYHFAEEGFAVATIEYRFYPDVFLKSIIHDALSACTFLKKEADKYGFDGSEMRLMGSSAGGHLSLIVSALSHKESIENDLPRAIGVVAQCPVSTLEGEERWDKIRNQMPLENCSPRHFDPGLFPKLFIQHGDADDLISLKYSEDFAEWINKNSGEAELDVLEGVGHGYGYSVHSEAGKIGYEKALAFFKGL